MTDKEEVGYKKFVFGCKIFVVLLLVVFPTILLIGNSFIPPMKDYIDQLKIVAVLGMDDWEKIQGFIMWTYFRSTWTGWDVTMINISRMFPWALLWTFYGITALIFLTYFILNLGQFND